MSQHWAVVGGGFRGIISAILLRRRGCEVTLIERAEHLGGLLYGGEWEGLFVDRGAHLFDNVDDAITELMHDILGDDITPVDVEYAVVMDDGKVDGLAVPDMSGMDEETQTRALAELVAAAAQPDDAAPGSLRDLYVRRFGPTLADRLDGPTRKMLRLPPEELGAEAFISTPFQRLRFLPDETARMLKQAPELDDRIALPVGGDPLRHYRHTATRYRHRNYYPCSKGMRAFCEKAKTYLETAGIELRLGQSLDDLSLGSGVTEISFADGESVAYDQVLWASPVNGLSQVLFGENPLMGAAQPVPMLMYYFLVPQDEVGPYAYMHDFNSTHLLFRPSAIGRYGGQVRPDGTTYVCLEAVTDRDSREWQDPEAFQEQIWEEARSLDFVHGDMPATAMIHKLPVTYVPAKVGFAERNGDLLRRIEERLGTGVYLLEQHSFTKVDIQHAIEKWLN